MLFRYLAAPAILLVFGATSVHGQGASSTAICGAEAAEFMPMLDGLWSVKQGAGRAVGSATVPLTATAPAIRRMIPMMVPEQDAVDFELEYAPNVGFSILSAPGQSMIMVPADRERALEELRHQREQEGEGAQREAPSCAGGPLPVVVGTNVYDLFDESGEAVEFRERHPSAPLFGVEYCTSNPLFQILSVVTRPFYHSGGEFGDEDNVLERGDDAREHCSSRARELAVEPGTMLMTLLVQFDSRTSGTGYVYFDGALGDDIEFSALAPVTLSR